MEIIKFKDMFTPFRGANTKNMPELTERETYKFLPYLEKFEKISVLSGSDSKEGLFGFVPNFLTPEDIKEKNHYIEKNKIRYFINKEGCITMIRCGNAGKLSYRSSEKYPLFSLTTSIFTFFKQEDSKIKLKYSNFDGLDLKWFYMRFNPLFSNLVNREGLSTIPLKIINEVDLEVPEIKIQKKQLELYERVYHLKNNLRKKIEVIKKIKEKSFEFDNQFESEKMLSYFLKYVSRNDALSEEGIYKRSQGLVNSKEKINVLSGSFRNIHGIVPFEEKIHAVKMKQGLHIITRGDAGKLEYLPIGNYATNTNAMLLLLKDEIKKELNINSEEDEKIYLMFLKYYLEPIFLKYVSSSDLSVLPLTKILDIIKISIIKLNNNIKEIVKDYEKLEEYNQNLNNSSMKIENLLQKEIIFN